MPLELLDDDDELELDELLELELLVVPLELLELELPVSTPQLAVRSELMMQA